MNRPTTPVKIYLAAPWVKRNYARAWGEKLVGAGFELTRRWWDEEAADDDFDTLKEHALGDLYAVCEADVVVVLNYEKSEGKAVETGAALISGIPVIVVTEGRPRSNIFQTLCTEVTSVDDAVQLIRSWYPRPVSA